MQVRISVAGEVVVDGKVDAFDVDAAAKDVGGDADALVEFFELFVALDAVVEGVVSLWCCSKETGHET